LRYTSAPIESQADAPLLTSEFVLAKEQVYENSARGFALDYPADWVLFESSFSVKFDPSEDDFKAASNSSIDRYPFTFIVTTPYVGLESEVYPISASTSAAVADEILSTFGEFEVLKPITSVNINGRDGATFLVERPQNRHQYIAILRINQDTTINLGALGPANRSEEMQEVLNAIALNFRPLEED
jgi:hypothetical protein